METFRKVLAKLTAVAVVLMVLADAGDFTCPPMDEEDEIGADQLIHFSDVVVLGQVVQTLQEPGSPLYRARMTVFCVYKGRNVPLTIDIAEAGDISDPCPEHQMEEGQLYMAYLYKHDDNRFTPAFPHHPDSYKDEMFIVCDLNISRPIGAVEAMEKEGLDITCKDNRPDYGDYEESEEEMCIRYTPKPGENPHRGKKKPNQPGKTGKVEREGEPGDGASLPTSSILLCLASPLLSAAALWSRLR